MSCLNRELSILENNFGHCQWAKDVTKIDIIRINLVLASLASQSQVIRLL